MSQQDVVIAGAARTPIGTFQGALASFSASDLAAIAASEAIQEAAVRALAARKRYDVARPFYPWFYRILKNHCFDRLRSRRIASSKAGSLRSESQRLATTTDAEDHILRGEREQAVARAIAQLPDDLRELIELRHFQDLSYQEMADVLGCPIGTVMSRLYRARKTLRSLLLKDPDFAARSTS